MNEVSEGEEGEEEKDNSGLGNTTYVGVSLKVFLRAYKGWVWTQTWVV